jgi:hypothetical protein
MIFPKAKSNERQLFTVRLDGDTERLSHAQAEHFKVNELSDEYGNSGQERTVEDILNGQVCNSSIFYVPSV